MPTPKPPVPYFGGKQKIAAKIVALFPEHQHYVEPFCGGLSVLMAKEPSHMETVNDLDQDIMTFWRVLRDRPADLERVCALTPLSRGEALLSANRDDVDELELARRVWVALTQRRGGQLMNTGFRHNVNPDTRVPMLRYLDGYLGRFAPAVERLRHVTLESKPALDIIEKYGAFADTLLYVDPPYLAGTRGTTTAYRHEMKAETAHRELADALHRAKASVVLSGYASPVYDELYADWNRTEITASTVQANRDSRGSSRTEVLWSNR